MRTRNILLKSTGWSLFVLLLLLGCAKNPVTGRRDFMLVSESQEIAMGKESDPDIIRYFGLYEDKKMQQFINEKGQQMAAISHRPKLKYEFKIVDSPVVNAFAVPGGYVYFTRGIMAHFNNEAEFAGVLGHEIGHIAARHSAKQYSNAMLAQVGLVAGVIIEPDLAQFADAAQQGVQLLFLKFGRDAETQSDKLGVEYSTKINYDADEMAHFFETLERLQKQSGAAEVPDFLSTHPNPGDREDNVERLAAKWKRKTSANLNVNRESYLKMIDGIVYGDDPRQGFTEDNVFYHPVMKFQFPYPSSWAVQNTPEQVQFGSSDGKAMMLFTLAPGSSLEEAAQKTIQNYGLTVVESKRDDVNGNRAIVMIADQQAGQEQPALRTLIYILEHGQRFYAMIGVTSQADFNNYYQSLNRSMSGFRTLTDPSKLNKQPERIDIQPVRQQGTLREALRHYRIPEKRLEEWAILNGMTLSDKVEKGMLIKVME